MGIHNNEELLDELEAERRKHSGSDDEKMVALVALLTLRGVYPSKTIRGGSVLGMVEYYGARWHLWRKPLSCPHCGSDQRDLKSGPPFSRSIAYISNDRAQKYVCPDCKKTFPLNSGLDT